MSDQQFAVNNAIFVQLAFNANCLSHCQGQFRRKMQPLFGDVYDVTQGRRLTFRHKAPSGYRHTKMMTVIRHRYAPSCLLAACAITIQPDGFNQRPAKSAISRMGKGARLISVMSIKGVMVISLADT